MRGEVGGDDSRQLVFIAVGDEVDDGTEHIAVFDDFARLGTNIARSSLSMSDRQFLGCVLQMLTMSLAL